MTSDKSRIAMLERALREALEYLPTTVTRDGKLYAILGNHWSPEEARACRDRIERDTGVHP